MGSVSIYISPIPPKEFSQKKKTSKSAKLKQCKLDVRREQWLSQVKENEKGKSSQTVFKSSQQKKTMESKNKLIVSGVEDTKPSSLHDISLKHLLCDTSTDTNNDVLSHEEPCSPPQLTSSSSNSSNSSSWSVSFSDDDDCLDDWEAMADALPLILLEHKVLEKTQVQNGIASPMALQKQITCKPQVQEVIVSPMALQKPSTDTETEKDTSRQPLIARKAWSVNDTFRPLSLPNHSSKIDTSRDSQLGNGGGNITISTCQTCCPICCEDFDITDSSFQPCTCGFQLCLFCYNRILEADSRCPGCRKQYIC